MTASLAAKPESGSLSFANRPVVYAIHENPDWFGPFAAALDAEGVPYVEWLLTGGVLDLDAGPPPGRVLVAILSLEPHPRSRARQGPHPVRAVLGGGGRSRGPSTGAR